MKTFVASAVSCPSDCLTPGPDCEYRIAWSLNPHMVIGGANPARARAQHATLLRTVRELGARVLEVPFVHGAFDSVFAKDNALYIARPGEMRAIMANPRYEERRLEQHARATALRGIGISVDSPRCPFEGGDLIVHDELAFLGHGFRSVAHAAPHLASILGHPVIALELVDPLLYHLDTALTILDDGTVIYCPDAFAPASVQRIHDTFDVVVSVSRDHAAAFALNVVEIGDTIVTGTDCPALTSIFRALRRDVVIVEVDEFQRAGGSVACLLGPVHTRIATEQRSAA